MNPLVRDFANETTHPELQDHVAGILLHRHKETPNN